MTREKAKTCFWPKKSHHSYYDGALQKKFYSKKEKLEFMNKHGFVEGDPASKAHMKRVHKFIDYCREEKKKNPNFKYTGAYPD